MATPPEQPWSNYEKNYLLAEIIKAANLPPEFLYNLIRSANIQPRWDDMPLPPGRSLNSSRFAYDELRRTLSQPMGLPPQNPTVGPASAQDTTTTALKRSYTQYEGAFAAGGPTGREIRPKPTVGGLYAHPSPSEPPPKRKRGRPTKAESQAKAEAAAAAASISVATSSTTLGGTDVGYAPGPPPAFPSSAQTPGPGSMSGPLPPMVGPASDEDVKPILPPVTRMPIAAMLTPTTREPKSASHSSSSSGKRRRARSTRSEPEEPGASRSGEYESPYARIRTGPDDSPARAAVMRHREEYGQPPRFAVPAPPPPPPPPAQPDPEAREEPAPAGTPQPTPPSSQPQ